MTSDSDIARTTSEISLREVVKILEPFEVKKFLSKTIFLNGDKPDGDVVAVVDRGYQLVSGGFEIFGAQCVYVLKNMPHPTKDDSWLVSFHLGENANVEGWAWAIGIRMKEA